MTRPKAPEHLDNNDSYGLLDWDNDNDGDLSIVRKYSYLRGIRALGGLMHLFEQTVSTQEIISIEITKVEILDGDCDDLTALPACEAYADVRIGGLVGRNEGDALEVGEGQFVMTSGNKQRWIWGNTVADASFTDTDTREKVFIKINLMDDDADTDGVQVDDVIDVSGPGTPGYVAIEVDVEKCRLREPSAIQILDAIGLPVAFGNCGDSIVTSNGADPYVGTAGGAITFVINLKRTGPVHSDGFEG